MSSALLQLLTNHETYSVLPMAPSLIAEALQKGEMVVALEERDAFPDRFLTGLWRDVTTKRGEQSQNISLRKHEEGLRSIFKALLEKGGVWWEEEATRTRSTTPSLLRMALELDLMEIARDLMAAPGAPSSALLDIPGSEEGSTTFLASTSPLGCVFEYWWRAWHKEDPVLVERYQQMMTLLHTQHGFSLDIPDALTGHTLFHEARVPFMVTYLLEHGAKTDLVAHSGEDPPTLWRQRLSLADYGKMMSAWNVATKQDRLALSAEERTARMLDTALGAVTTKGRFVAHLRQWGFKKKDTGCDGEGWAHWIGATQRLHQCARILTPRSTYAFMGAPRMKNYGLGCFSLQAAEWRETIRTHSNHSPEKDVVGEKVWPLVLERSHYSAQTLRAQLPWLLITHDNVDEQRVTALTAHPCFEHALGNAKGKPLDLIGLWQEARHTFQHELPSLLQACEKKENPPGFFKLNATDLADLTGSVKKKVSQEEQAAILIVLMEGWMTGILQALKPTGHLTSTSYTAWRADVARLSPEEQVCFWNTFKRATLYHVGPNDTPWAWMQTSTNNVALESSDWLRVIPFLHAELARELCSLHASERASFKDRLQAMFEKGNTLKILGGRKDVLLYDALFDAHNLLKQTPPLDVKTIRAFEPFLAEKWPLALSSLAHPFRSFFESVLLEKSMEAPVQQGRRLRV